MMGVPDNLIGTISHQIAPRLKRVHAAYAGRGGALRRVLPDRADLTYFLIIRAIHL